MQGTNASAPSVLRAVRSGRLADSIVFVDGKAKIVDAAAADVEWAATTDCTRARIVDAAVTGLRPEVTADVTGKSQHSPLAAATLQIARERGRKLQIENDVTSGRLIEKAVVAKVNFEVGRVLREAVLNIPSRLGPEIAAERDADKVFRLLDTELRRALHTAADRIKELKFDDTGDTDQ